ncbi:MAG: hypothetical protein P1U34_11120 [Coxiellaceae bacterium]|nr:hypothetical protein [Coxiellaceae bacterium]
MNDKLPRTLRISIQLLVFVCIDWLLLVVLDLFSINVGDVTPTLFYQYTPPLLIADFLLYVIFITIMIYFMTQKKNWARILIISYTLIRFTIDIYMGTIFKSTMLIDLFIVIYTVLQIAITILLFSPDTNEWFRSAALRQPNAHLFYGKNNTPNTVISAINIFILLTILFVIINLLEYINYHASPLLPHIANIHNTWFLVKDILYHITLYCLFIYAISRRINWARILFLVLWLADISLYLTYMHYYTSFNNTLNILITIYQPIAFIGFTLLFTPSSNAWFLRKEKPPTTIDSLP